jgi:hypothetical protein
MERKTGTTMLYAAAALSLVAALFHFWVMPEHFAEWWGYGAFFLVVAVAQALYACALPRWPQPWLLELGIAGNLAVVALWAWTRTVGIPLFGPHAGEVEAVGRIDVASALAEVALVAILVAILVGVRQGLCGAGRGASVRAPRNGSPSHP